MSYDELLLSIRTEFPRFRIKRKTESSFMKAVALFLRIITFGRQNRFMTDFVTTIGQTVYIPDGWGHWPTNSQINVLCHERVHMRQARRLSMPLFAFLYLFVPLPLGLAYCRARLEWEAYEETMRTTALHYGISALSANGYRESIIRHFTTGDYGWMWPFRRMVERWYEQSRQKIAQERSGD